MEPKRLTRRLALEAGGRVSTWFRHASLEHAHASKHSAVSIETLEECGTQPLLVLAALSPKEFIDDAEACKHSHS